MNSTSTRAKGKGLVRQGESQQRHPLLDLLGGDVNNVGESRASNSWLPWVLGVLDRRSHRSLGKSRLGERNEDGTEAQITAGQIVHSHARELGRGGVPTTGRLGFVIVL